MINFLYCQTTLPEPYLLGLFRLVFRIYFIFLKTLLATVEYTVQMFSRM